MAVLSEEQLNFFKFSTLVFGEFPKVLRKFFKKMWDSKFSDVWDDSTTVRSMLLASEGGKTEIPTSKSVEEWDCTALFKATIYAKTFGIPRVSKPVPGPFHPNVKSTTGNQDETYALVIDQLRLLRNTLCHSPRPEIAKEHFVHYVQLVKDALSAVNVDTTFVNEVGEMSEDDFPTEKVQQCVKKLLEIMVQKFSSLDERIERIEKVICNGLGNKRDATVSLPSTATDPSPSSDKMCSSCVSMGETRLPDDRNKWPINKIEPACYEEVCQLLDLDDRSKVSLLGALEIFDQIKAAFIKKKYSNSGGVGIAKYALDQWGAQHRSHDVGALKDILKNKMKREDVIEVIEKWEKLNVCHGCGIKLQENN